MPRKVWRKWWEFKGKLWRRGWRWQCLTLPYISIFFPLFSLCPFPFIQVLVCLISLLQFSFFHPSQSLYFSYSSDICLLLSYLLHSFLSSLFLFLHSQSFFLPSSLNFERVVTAVGRKESTGGTVPKPTRPSRVENPTQPHPDSRPYCNPGTWAPVSRSLSLHYHAIQRFFLGRPLFYCYSFFLYIYMYASYPSPLPLPPPCYSWSFFFLVIHGILVFKVEEDEEEEKGEEIKRERLNGWLNGGRGRGGRGEKIKEQR